MYATFLLIHGYLMLEGPVSNLSEQLPNFKNELVKHLSCVTTQLLLAFCQKLLVQWFYWRILDAYCVSSILLN